MTTQSIVYLVLRKQQVYYKLLTLQEKHCKFPVIAEGWHNLRKKAFEAIRTTLKEIYE